MLKGPFTQAIFIAPKLQLQNRTCKPGAIFSAICRRDIAGVSNMFETCCNFSATKTASSCRDKNRLCKRALRKAKDIVFWPGMYSEIKAILERCTVCAEFQAKNASQPRQSHQISDRPWSKVATDLFTVSGNNYITIVDYFSDFVEVSELEDTTSHAVIQVLKEQFSRHGIPDTVISDNGPQFSSQEFHEFSLTWEFNHVTSSPHYSKSNGKAESSVKAVKNLFKKAERDGKDPWLPLLDYRHTPTKGINASPAQRLMSRRTRTLLPTASSLLRSEVCAQSTEKLERKRQKAKFHHDPHARQLPEDWSRSQNSTPAEEPNVAEGSYLC